jgi:hypothetical protein
MKPVITYNHENRDWTCRSEFGMLSIWGYTPEHAYKEWFKRFMDFMDTAKWKGVTYRDMLDNKPLQEYVHKNTNFYLCRGDMPRVSSDK